MKINTQQPSTAESTTTSKGVDGGKDKTADGKPAGSKGSFENILEGKMPPQDPLIKGQLPKGQLLKDQTIGQQASGEKDGMAVLEDAQTGGATSKKDGAPLSEKLFKNVMDKMDKSDVGGGTPGSQGFPLSTYLEPPSLPKVDQAESAQGPQLNVHEIEKMVDRMLVGVNASGDPQIKLDVHLNSLGPLNIDVTRTDAGLQIHLNAETERAGLQLSQNLPQLQEILAQKGLQVDAIQLLVANEPLALNQLIDAPRAGSLDRVHRKDRVQKLTTDKPTKSTPPGGRG